MTRSYTVTGTYTVIVTATNSVGGSSAQHIVTVVDGWTLEEILIPAGSFKMGCDSSNSAEYGCNSSFQANELPTHTVTLDAYTIDKYEVTNARYKACVNAGGCTAPQNVNSYARSPYYGTSTYANYPVIHVDWHQASPPCRCEAGRNFSKRAFCRSSKGLRMGKLCRHLWHELTSFANLLLAFRGAARGKRSAWSAPP